MRDSADRERAEGERLYTFGLKYRYGLDYGLEELDIYAPNYERAKAIALELAERDYEPGWIEMIDMDPGGSAGLVQIWR